MGVLTWKSKCIESRFSAKERKYTGNKQETYRIICQQKTERNNEENLELVRDKGVSEQLGSRSKREIRKLRKFQGRLKKI